MTTEPTADETMRSLAADMLERLRMTLVGDKDE